MRAQRRPERRSDPRHAVTWTLQGKGISPAGFPQREPEIVQGRIENINRTGLCLVTKKRLEQSSVLHCEIFPAGHRIGIPTMMEVRWLQPDSKGTGTRVGLRFLV